MDLFPVKAFKIYSYFSAIFPFFMRNLLSCLFVLGPCEPYCNGEKPSLFLEEDNLWPGNNPGSQGLGRVTAVDIDSQGNVFIFHRASRIWQAE